MAPNSFGLKDKQRSSLSPIGAPSFTITPSTLMASAMSNNNNNNNNHNSIGERTTDRMPSHGSHMGPNGLPRSATVPPPAPQSSLDRPSSYNYQGQHAQYQQHHHQQQQHHQHGSQSQYGRAPLLTRPASAPAKTGAANDNSLFPPSRSISPAPQLTSLAAAPNLGPPPFASNLFPPLSVSNINSPAALAPLLALSLSPPQSTVAFVDQRSDATRKRHDDYMNSFRTRPCRSPSCTSVTCFGVHARQVYYLARPSY
jgi:hypothetical protein